MKYQDSAFQAISGLMYDLLQPDCILASVDSPKYMYIKKVARGVCNCNFSKLSYPLLFFA